MSPLRRDISAVITKVEIAKRKEHESRLIVSQPPKSLLFPIVVDQAVKAICRAVQRESYKEEFDLVAQNSFQSGDRRKEAKASQLLEELCSLPAKPCHQVRRRSQGGRSSPSDPPNLPRKEPCVAAQRDTKCQR